MTRRLLAALAALPLLAPAAASAATVEVTPCATRYCGHDALTVRAPGSEVNRLEIASTAGALEVTDRGGVAPQPGPGCERTAPDAVRCAGAGVVSVDTGDGDDTVAVRTVAGLPYVSVHAGGGDDTVTGGPGVDLLDGGGGRDRLAGGAGEDRLRDGDAPRAPDADVIDGGTGRDFLDYADRRAPVTVRLDRTGSARRAGQAGEGDQVTGIDGVLGGAGDDVLWASDAGARPELSDEDGSHGLSGGFGDNVLRGGSGPDAVLAEGRVDRVATGGGPDRITLPGARTLGGARVDCGRGRDAVEAAGPRDVMRGCEVIEPAYLFGTFATVPLAQGAVRLAELDAERLRIAVRVDAGPHAGGLIARGTLREPGRLRTTRLARRLARRGAALRLRVTVLGASSGARAGFRLGGG